MKKLTAKQRRKYLEAIDAIPDDQIDLSDIPRGVRGRFYRPLKKPVTMRLDADVIAWLKQDGPGYQTKANRLLREQMLRALQQPKRPRKRVRRAG